MSSVLKALQRLEKQRSFEEISNRSDLNAVDAPTVIRRQAMRSHSSRRRLLIGLIVLIIGVGTLLALAKTVFWNPRPDTTGTSPQKTVARISKLTTVPEVKKPAFVSSARPQKPTAMASHTYSPVRPVNKKVITGKKRLTALTPATPSRTMPKSDRMTPPARKTKKPFPQKTKAIPQRAATRKSKVALGRAKTVTPFPRSPKSAIPNKHIKQPKREILKAKSAHKPPSEAPKELGLKLQAITWLNNPQKRFTVINGSIVRLGEMVDGFRLIRIEEDQVTIEKDNRKWLLKFNRMDYSNVTP